MMTKQERKKFKLLKRLEKDYELAREYLKISPKSGNIKYYIGKAILEIKTSQINIFKE